MFVRTSFAAIFPSSRCIPVPIWQSLTLHLDSTLTFEHKILFLMWQLSPMMTWSMMMQLLIFTLFPSLQCVPNTLFFTLTFSPMEQFAPTRDPAFRNFGNDGSNSKGFHGALFAFWIYSVPGIFVDAFTWLLAATRSIFLFTLGGRTHARTYVCE